MIYVSNQCYQETKAGRESSKPKNISMTYFSILLATILAMIYRNSRVSSSVDAFHYSSLLSILVIRFVFLQSENAWHSGPE